MLRGEEKLVRWKIWMSEVSGASEHSVNNAKLSFMLIYLFKYASAVLNNWGSCDSNK